MRSLPPETPAFTWAWTLVFCALSFVKLLRHEMWRDELRAWLIAKASPSLGALFHNLRYEGHPPLWYLPLYALSRFTDQAQVMQLLHLAIATASVYVVSRFSPFTRLQKVLIAFGYFPAFEYVVISRNYAPGMLLTFIFCAAYAARRRSYLALSAIALLLAQTSAHGIIVAIALSVSCALDATLAGRQARARRAARWPAIGSAAAAFLGIVGTMVALAPPADSGVFVEWTTTLYMPRLAFLTATLWRAYVPIPELAYHFWSTNVLGTTRETLWWQALLALPLYGVSLLVLARKPAALCLWVCGSSGLLAFWYVKHQGSLRHHGHLVILILAACWISASCRAWEIRSPILRQAVAVCDRHRQGLLTALLTVQVLAGVFASGMDLALPFSASPEVARFIRAHYPRDIPIVGDLDGPAMAVAGHLNRDVYYPASQRTGTFVIQDNRRQPVSEEALLARVEDLVSETRRDVLLVLSYELSRAAPGLEFVRSFTRSIVQSEVYHLYVARYAR